MQCTYHIGVFLFGISVYEVDIWLMACIILVTALGNSQLCHFILNGFGNQNKKIVVSWFNYNFQ